MTGPVTFGDLLDQARHHLDAAGRIPGRPGNELELLDATRGMYAVITAISPYFSDILTGYAKASVRESRAVHRSPDLARRWPAAFIHARRAAVCAARYLEPATVVRPSGAAATERGQHLNAAALALIAGRDLLHMHTATKPDGNREDRSSWAPVVSAPACRRAIAAEMAALARQAAAVGAAFVTIPAIRWDLTTDSRKAMYNASQSLRVLHGAIQAANRQSPIVAADRDLVRAVPIHVRPARRLPDGTESITSLCNGVIVAAERLRQSSRLAAERNFRSPDLNIESLRCAAAASTAATQNCTIVLNALGEAPGIAQPHETRAELAQAIGTAIRARDSWLSVAHALGEFTSDVPGHISAEAADAHDLALWTGRLAYAETTWTPAHSPGRQVRPAAELAGRPETVALVGAAVHHASDSLRHLAAVHQQQAQIAARGRRLLLPTDSLPPGYRIANRYAPAPRYCAHQLIADYQVAGTATRQAAASVSNIAEMTDAPSTTLTRATEVVLQNNRDGYIRSAPRSRQPAEYNAPELPGPIERSLQGLGVTDQLQLSRAAAIDHVGEQLILESCAISHSGHSALPKILSPDQGTRMANEVHLDVTVADLISGRVPLLADDMEREP
jgi:hypothetical protein